MSSKHPLLRSSAAAGEMWRPRYEVTATIRDTLAGVEANANAAHGISLPARHEAWLRRDVQIERASATTRIEGATLGEAAVHELVKQGRPGRLTADERANLNAIEAYDFVDYMSDQHDIPLDELAIREVNRIFLRGAAETLTPGVYRNGQNTVGEYQPPDQGDVPGLMRAFAAWLATEDEEAHPVLRAGLAYMQVVAVHPFWDGNGRTARALAALVLQRSPHGFRKLLSLERFMFQRRDEYFSAVRRTLGERYRDGYDATPWLEFFTQALRQHSAEVTRRLTDWQENIVRVRRAEEGGGVSARQAEALAFVLRTGRITRADYLDITAVSAITASRDLKDLVERGWLVARGRTRAREYAPGSALREPSR